MSFPVSVERIQPMILEAPHISAIQAEKASQPLSELEREREGMLVFMQDIYQKAQMQISQLKAVVPSSKERELCKLVRCVEVLKPCAVPSNAQARAQLIEEVQQRNKYFLVQVKCFENSVVAELQDTLYILPDLAKTLFLGVQNNWQSMCTARPDGLIQQSHNITYLKIFMLPSTGQLVAHFAKDIIGEGACKRVKEVQQIFGSSIVRLTSRAKGPLPKGSDVQELDELFQSDMQRELFARKALDGIPHISQLTVLQYCNAKGFLKTRYVMPKYEGDLWELTHSSAKSFDRKRALLCCSDVFDCICEIHKKRYVHGDVKHSNVLVQGNHGYLADFGLFHPIGKELHIVGVPAYMAPETFLYMNKIVYDSKMDVFSLGILLLGIVSPHCYSAWQKDTRPFLAEITSVEQTADEEYGKILTERESLQQKAKSGSSPDVDQALAANRVKEVALRQKTSLAFKGKRDRYFEMYSALLKRLSSINDPFIILIQQLVSFDPQARPSSEFAKVIFTEIFAKTC
jgi:serine/threonine protein kinase